MRTTQNHGSNTQDLSQAVISGADTERVKTTTMRATRGGQEFAVQVDETTTPDSLRFGAKMRALGLAVVAVCAAQAPGIVIAPNGTNAAARAAGDNLSTTQGLMAVRGVHQSGSEFTASATLITDIEGNLRTIAPKPALGVGLMVGGFGTYGFADQPLNPQDGLPRGGTAPSATVPSYVNPAFFGGTFFSPGTYGVTNVNGAPGDSGGYIGTGAAVTGINSAVIGENSSFGKTLFSRLDVPEVQTWINTKTSGGGIWALTAAHVSIDLSDPVTLTNIFGGDFNAPSSTFNVVQTINYPTSLSNSYSVDFQHPDITLLRLEPTIAPEPGFALTALGVIGSLLIRRKNRLS